MVDTQLSFGWTLVWITTSPLIISNFMWTLILCFIMQKISPWVINWLVCEFVLFGISNACSICWAFKSKWWFWTQMNYYIAFLLNTQISWILLGYKFTKFSAIYIYLLGVYTIIMHRLRSYLHSKICSGWYEWHAMCLSPSIC